MHCNTIHGGLRERGLHGRGLRGRGLRGQRTYECLSKHKSWLCHSTKLRISLCFSSQVMFLWRSENCRQPVVRLTWFIMDFLKYFLNCLSITLEKRDTISKYSSSSRVFLFESRSSKSQLTACWCWCRTFAKQYPPTCRMFPRAPLVLTSSGRLRATKNRGHIIVGETWVKRDTA